MSAIGRAPYDIPSYTIFDAALNYRLDRWRFQLNAYNLFDRHYYDLASPTGQRSVLVGEPLTVRGSVAIAF